MGLFRGPIWFSDSPGDHGVMVPWSLSRVELYQGKLGQSLPVVGEAGCEIDG